MPTERERVESLFEAALELAPERRRDFVLAACGTNDAMRSAGTAPAGHSFRIRPRAF